MLCPKCGKDNPTGAKFCNFCGAEMPERGPRHARPETENDEIYSYSDQKNSDDFKKLNGSVEETKVYDFGKFEDNKAADDKDQKQPYDDRNRIGDSYETYQDGEDDRTMMDKLDDKFRRDDDRRPTKKRSLAWLWITLSVFAVAGIIIAVVLIVNGAKAKGNKKVAPSAAPTVSATVKATDAPTTAATIPAPTQAPATQAPATQAPAPTEAPAPIVTEAPALPTEAPAPIQTNEPVIPDDASSSAENINNAE